MGINIIILRLRAILIKGQFRNIETSEWHARNRASFYTYNTVTMHSPVSGQYIEQKLLRAARVVPNIA